MWLKINRNATLIMGSQRSAYGLKIQEYIAVDIKRCTCRIQYSFIKRLRNMGKKIIVLATKNPDKKKLLPYNVTITKLLIHVLLVTKQCIGKGIYEIMHTLTH